MLCRCYFLMADLGWISLIGYAALKFSACQMFLVRIKYKNNRSSWLLHLQRISIWLVNVVNSKIFGICPILCWTIYAGTECTITLSSVICKIGSVIICADADCTNSEFKPVDWINLFIFPWLNSHVYHLFIKQSNRSY